MKRALAALAGIAGIALLRKRRAAEQQQPPPDPADDLRTKLAESRAAQAEDDVAETPVDLDVEERRREVHERARQQIDELSGD